MRVICLCIIAILVAASGCHRQPPERKPTPVEVFVARSQDAAAGYPYSAVVNPYTQVDVAFRTEGYVRVIPSRKALGQTRLLQGGDYVKRHEELAKIDDEQYRDRVVEAAANVSKAEAERRKADLNYKRATALFATASITAPDYDSAREEYEIAQAAVVGTKAHLDRAEEELRDTVLRSPLTGIILQRNIEVGTLVHSQSVGFVVADISRVKVVFSVPDIVLSYAPLGSVVSLRTESLPDLTFKGMITEVSPMADPRTRVFAITVTVDNPKAQLRVGMIMSLALDKIPIPPDRVLIPLSCLVAHPGKSKGFAVFVLERDSEVLRAKLRKVLPGQVVGNNIVIIQGLTEGEEVVSTGAAQLSDGKAIIVVP
ncbi:efflux RND transporter periplasmic adaptor subunit [Microbulbifer sp. TRSA002]|uniref:efflux RND transporter periplasmic adaptor subunit n=1 Tax=Microbulbifer sp. TRSA002 TaxID=3243382 RepID=UPI0040391118